MLRILKAEGVGNLGYVIASRSQKMLCHIYHMARNQLLSRNPCLFFYQVTEIARSQIGFVGKICHGGEAVTGFA